ncbi:MAG: DNA repair protein RadA, partial [Nitrospinota bacterium]
GGDPGIGKSTLASQVAGADNQFGLTLYVSGEESSTQVKGRSERLKLNLDKILFTPETNVEIIAQEVIKLQPSLLIVDSIQTIFTEQLSSAPGSVGQIRESAAILLNVAKSMLIPVILIGHVTKEGAIAGPRVLEHMVDVVLYFEGEQGSPFRIVRSVKNRFGSSLELGLFEMKADGLISIENPSSMLLAERALNIPGSVVSATIAGFRPLLVEIQALVAPSFYPSPKRTGVGIDLNRLSIIIAIIEKRAGIHIGQEDIFVNAVGGVKVEEPAIDLAIAVAIVSGFRNIPIDNQTVVFGELGLGAEVRAAPRLDARLNEAKRLGFKRALVPKKFLDGKELSDSFKLEPIETLAQALEILF